MAVSFMVPGTWHRLLFLFFRPYSGGMSRLLRQVRCGEICRQGASGKLVGAPAEVRPFRDVSGPGDVGTGEVGFLMWSHPKMPDNL